MAKRKIINNQISNRLGLRLLLVMAILVIAGFGDIVNKKL